MQEQEQEQVSELTLGLEEQNPEVQSMEMARLVDTD